MSHESRRRERNYHLAGWALFLICAIFFVASSLATHNVLSLTGSAIFLIACVIFMIPLLFRGDQDS